MGTETFWWRSSKVSGKFKHALERWFILLNAQCDSESEWYCVRAITLIFIIDAKWKCEFGWWFWCQRTAVAAMSSRVVHGGFHDYYFACLNTTIIPPTTQLTIQFQYSNKALGCITVVESKSPQHHLTHEPQLSQHRSTPKPNAMNASVDLIQRGYHMELEFRIYSPTPLHLMILQPLPPSTIVDPYELSGMVNTNKTEISHHGGIDLESMDGSWNVIALSTSMFGNRQHPNQ